MRFVVLAYLVGLTTVAEQSREAEQTPLSDEVQESKEFDHESLSGEEPNELGEFSTEETVRRLGILADHFDKNRDRKIGKDELKEWIKTARFSYIDEEAQNQMIAADNNSNGVMEWEEYYTITYGHITEDDMDENEKQRALRYKKRMVIRDQKRWDYADQNGDDVLAKEEVMGFLHPESYQHMKTIVLHETFEDRDKDSDGYISLKEYLGNMYNPEKDGENKWLKLEREQFTFHIDANKDGKLDKDEFQSWLLSGKQDDIDIEASHLILEIDDDKDDLLSKQEILDHHFRFIGSDMLNLIEDREKQEL